MGSTMFAVGLSHHVKLSVCYLSLSPNHFDTRSDDDTEMNVELFASVATAFAR